VGNYCYARRREALRRPQREERGGGISWRPPAYSLLKKENELAMHWEEMRTIRWMCDVNLRQKLFSIGFSHLLEIEGRVKLVQNYTAMVCKDDDDWVKIIIIIIKISPVME